jgi:diguanylate cyclase (GGDEF)-like protein
VAVLLIDVDKLKEINDGDGHRAGDEALQRVATALTRSVRISDVVGRLGGDEFLVIAPQTNARDACALAERIAQATRKETRGHRSVGLSIGVATTSLVGPNPRDLLDGADVAMYEAKKRGGNCVVGPGKKRLAKVVPIRRGRMPLN